ncbi:MAG TPA: SRPBCC family protein [Mycobacterium sp.]|nr:SRPBCC family protein [Mycobacterium sp.]
MALVVEQSRSIPVTVEDAFAGTLPLPLPTLFRHWYGPIPPIKAVREQTGDWDAAGRARTVLLTGGGSMRERLTEIDAPHSFDYTLTEITGPMAPLVRLIEGQWQFTPDGDGTRVTWRWSIHPRSVLSTPALPVLGWLWRGYARRALAELSVLLGG